MTNEAPAQTLLEELDARQNEVLDELERLNIRIERAIAETIAGAGITDPLVVRAAAVALGKYAAAAMLMPYARFLSACEVPERKPVILAVNGYSEK